jgi:DNA repair protein RadA
LDSILGGGIESQSITEFYGEYGSGKSQICHQLCVNAQLPIKKGGLNGAVLFVDTENTFRTERIFQISNYLSLNPKKVAEKIIYAEAYNSEHQIHLLDNAEKVIKENNIKLLIIDSLTGHFRSEYIGREMLASRQQKLNLYMHKLARLAKIFNAVVVVTNQVASKPDAFLNDSVYPIGGHIVGHVSHTRVFLRKASRRTVRIARLVSSPHLPEKEEIFKITENGIEDIIKDKKTI